MSFDLDLDFPDMIDTGDYQTENNFSELKPGKYEALIVAGNVKQTQNKQGKYLSLEFEILGPTNEGRKLFHIFNLWNQNETAVVIARQQIKSLCLACFGRDQRINSASIFLDQRCTIMLGYKKELYNGEKQIGIKFFVKKEETKMKTIAHAPSLNHTPHAHANVGDGFDDTPF